MRTTLLALIAFTLAFPACGWELLTTKNGTRIEGDITQKEFLLEDPAGGDIVIPRAAIDRLESTGEMISATLKDGTVVAGHLKGVVEIEDGLIKRRYAGSDIEGVEFDTYIDIEKGETYHSCPIRLSLAASKVLLSDSATSTSLTGAVACNELRIANVAFSRRGDLSRGKDASVNARFSVSVPNGADQLAELSFDLVQDGQVLAATRKRLTIDEGEVNVVSLKLTVPGDRFDEKGAEPRFRVQLVNQDESSEVERGGFFWWFTIQVPL